MGRVRRDRGAPNRSPLYWLQNGGVDIVALGIIGLGVRILLAVAFIGMGITHFLPPVQRTMAAMIPGALRWKGLASPRNLVIATGVCEIAGGFGLLYPPTVLAATICLIVFLVAVFPANAYAAGHRERFGRVAMPLVPRALGQIALIVLLVLGAVLA